MSASKQQHSGARRTTYLAHAEILVENVDVVAVVDDGHLVLPHRRAVVVLLEGLVLVLRGAGAGHSCRGECRVSDIDPSVESFGRSIKSRARSM